MPAKKKMEGEKYFIVAGDTDPMGPFSKSELSEEFNELTNDFRDNHICIWKAANVKWTRGDIVIHDS